MDINKIPDINDAALDEMMFSKAKMTYLPDVADSLNAKKGHQDVFPVGFEIFNAVMDGGITEGDLVVISGRSGHGKTTFAQTITWQLSQIGIPVAWFSYEMTIPQLWKKFEEMGLNRQNFTGYTPSKHEDSDIEWLRGKVKEAVLKFNVKTIFIDHLGFLSSSMPLSKDFDRNFSSYLGHLVREIKLMALQEGVSVVLLAHTRKTKEDLTMEDIAHSAGVAQESDFVFMVERLPETQQKRSKWDMQVEGEVLSKYTKISLVKNRRTGYQKFIKAELKNGRLQEVKAHNVLETDNERIDEIISIG